MKRVLVTGASGFVGRACLRALSGSGCEVHAVSRQALPSCSGAVWHVGDIKNSAEMVAILRAVQPTHLLHLAWCTEPGSFWNSPENDVWLAASIRLFETFAENGGSRIVGIGSCAEYEWSDHPCNEHTSKCLPSTAYGRAKLAACDYLGSLRRSSLTTAWARLFFLYGPGGSPQRIPGAVIASLARGEVARCSLGLQQRDFLHIDDAATALVMLLESAAEGPMNICSGAGTTIAEIARRTAQVIGRPDLLQLGAIPTPEGDPPMIVGDNSRLRHELGWRPKYDLESGLHATVAEWRVRAAQVAA